MLLFAGSSPSKSEVRHTETRVAGALIRFGSNALVALSLLMFGAGWATTLQAGVGVLRCPGAVCNPPVGGVCTAPCLGLQNCVLGASDCCCS